VQNSPERRNCDACWSCSVSQGDARTKRRGATAASDALRRTARAEEGRLDPQRHGGWRKGGFGRRLRPTGLGAPRGGQPCHKCARMQRQRHRKGLHQRLDPLASRNPVKAATAGMAGSVRRKRWRSRVIRAGSRVTRLVRARKVGPRSGRAGQVASHQADRRRNQRPDQDHGQD